MSALPTTQGVAPPFPVSFPAHLKGLLPTLSASIQSRSTPDRLRFIQVFGIVVTAAFGLASWFTYHELYAAVKTVGQDTVPSIVAALHLRANIAEANADAVNAFLMKEKEDGPNWTAFRKHMDEEHSAMMTAAGNITYGKEESEPLLTIMTSMAVYEQRVGVARGLLAQGNGGYADAMLKADRLAHGTLLPACTALADANTRHLDELYNAYRARSFATLVPAALLGLVLLAGLAYAQWDLFKTMRRFLNPGLAGATLTLSLFSIYGFFTFFAAREDLRLAKKDAFDSANALWEARSIGKDANAEESLYLLAHGNSQEQAVRTKAFNEKAALLMPMSSMDALSLVRAGRTVNGFLGRELANITFNGEREAAMNALAAWGQYHAIDARIRELEQRGDFDDALALDIGTQRGQSNWAFAEFDRWVGRTLEINETEFHAATNRAFGRLGAFPYLLTATVLLVAGATFAGIKPRLDEYRF